MITLISDFPWKPLFILQASSLSSLHISPSWDDRKEREKINCAKKQHENDCWMNEWMKILSCQKHKDSLDEIDMGNLKLSLRMKPLIHLEIKMF